MRILKNSLSSKIALIGASLTLTSLASAEDNYVILLLDTSGSMAHEDAGTDAQPLTRWEKGRADLVASVVGTGGDRFQEFDATHYAIWTFSESEVKQVWPTATSCNVPGAANQLTKNGNFCTVVTPQAFQTVDLAVEEFTQQPDFGPNTPLADGLCSQLNTAHDEASGDDQFTIRLLSDGNESGSFFDGSGAVGGSIGECFQFNSGDIVHEPTDKLFDATLADAGLSTSWQRNVYRRSYYTESTWKSTVVPANPETLESRFNIAVDILAVYSTNPVPLPNQLMASRYFTVPTNSDGGPAETLQYQFFSTLASEEPVTPAQLGLPDYVDLNVISANLTSFFQGLAETTGGSFIPVYTPPGTVYGVNHVRAGDVDDSGCADGADLSIIGQSDIYGAQAVAPNQLAIRADLNKDGWVTSGDKAVLLAPENWGEGCANPPTHPTGGPSCHNNVLDGDETDTDCGGDACGPCAAKSVCEEDLDCVSGDCEGARCVATTSCTASNAIDLGAPGVSKTVANNACVKLQNGLPSWWGTSRKVLLQTGSGGKYPVPYHWESSCKGTQGSGNLSGNWQSRTFGPTSKSCATVIKLDGTGGNVKLTYYGQ